MLRWYLYLWMARLLRVGQCLPHKGQARPALSTCFASTWTSTADARVEENWHLVQPWRPPSSLHTNDLIKSFSSSNDRIQSLIVFVNTTMDIKSIFSFTELFTNRTIIARGGNVVCLDVFSDVWLIHAHIVTVCTTPRFWRRIPDCLGVDHLSEQIYK